MFQPKDTDALHIWPAAVEILRAPMVDLVGLNPGGPNGLTTWSKVYDTADDPVGVPGCILCLEKWVDGSPITIRRRRYEVMTKDYYDLNVRSAYV